MHADAIKHVDDRAGKNRLGEIFLDEEILDAELHRLDGKLEIPCCSHKHDRDFAIQLVELQAEFESVGSGEHIVSEDEIDRRVLLYFRERIFHALLPHHLEFPILKPLQMVLNDLCKTYVVVDEEDGDRFLRLDHGRLRCAVKR